MSQAAADSNDDRAGSGSARRLWTVGVAALVLSICANLLVPTIADPDLWGHVLFGKLTLALGHVARIDPYAYASAGTWINHEWLAEVVFGAAHDLGGNAGLVLLKTGLGLALLAWIYRRMARAGLDVLRAGAILFLGAVPLIVVLGSLRPHVFTFLLFGATLAVLRAAEENRSALWWLVPATALWVNLHGGFLAGLGVAGVWVAVTVVGDLLPRSETEKAPGSRARRIGGPVAALGAACAATLVNPYGAELPAFLLETATVARPYISEWQPVDLTSSLGIVYLLLVGWSGLTLWRADERPPLPRLVVLAVTAVTPLLAVRHLPLFALSVLLLLDDTMAAAWARSGSEGSSILQRGGWLPRTAGTVALLLAGIVVVRTASEPPCVRVKFSEDVRYPTRAVALLDASGVEADLAIFFNWGEYAIWHLSPRVQVGMDGRRETVYPDSIYRSYLRFVGGGGEWDAYLDVGPADLALVPPDEAAFNLLELHDGWTRVYDDSVAGLFGRRGSRVTRAVAATPVPDVPVDGAGTCFPGPVGTQPETR